MLTRYFSNFKVPTFSEEISAAVNMGDLELCISSYEKCSSFTEL
jgi:hypothetical protein